MTKRRPFAGAVHGDRERDVDRAVGHVAVANLDVDGIVARRQYGMVDSASAETGWDNELVVYDTPAHAAAAAQWHTPAGTCPHTPVHSKVAGEPDFTYRISLNTLDVATFPAKLNVVTTETGTASRTRAVQHLDPTRVLAVFDAAQRWSWGMNRGCAFVNAYAEIGGTDHPGVAIIRAEKTWMHNRFTELVTEADIPNPERVAGAAHLLYEGALVISTAGGDPHALAAARAATEQLL